MTSSTRRRPLTAQLGAGQPAAGLAALGQQLVEPPDRLARLLELVPGQRQLAHRRQGARRQDRGRDQGADGHVADHDHPGAEIDQHQRGQVLERLAQAAGEVGDAAGLQPGPGAAQQMALEAPLHVGLERQELDRQRLAHGLAQSGGLGPDGAEAGTLMQLLAALREHGQEHEGGHRGGRDQAQGRRDDEQGGEEQADEGEVDDQQRQVAGEELAQLVDLAHALHAPRRSGSSRRSGRAGAAGGGRGRCRSRPPAARRYGR